MLKKCLLPVAGYGTRFLPATKAMLKEMLVLAYRFSGRRFDCGSVADFVDATNFHYHQKYGC